MTALCSHCGETIDELNPGSGVWTHRNTGAVGCAQTAPGAPRTSARPGVAA